MPYGVFAEIILILMKVTMGAVDKDDKAQQAFTRIIKGMDQSVGKMKTRRTQYDEFKKKLKEL